jgi:mevalonate kinase
MAELKLIPMRVDFAGGWLDVPKLAIPGGFIVNCAITPYFDYPYRFGGGLGGSAAAAIAAGKDAFEQELGTAGWQDPAVILETGLCVWRSGAGPVLEMKANPDFLAGRMAILWTGKSHSTKELIDLNRNYRQILSASKVAREAVGMVPGKFHALASAVDITYRTQLEEGMDPLPNADDASCKYLGSGHGGYALYLFHWRERRKQFLTQHANLAISIEPYIRPISS